MVVQIGATRGATEGNKERNICIAPFPPPALHSPPRTYPDNEEEEKRKEANVRMV